MQNKKYTRPIVQNENHFLTSLRGVKERRGEMINSGDFAVLRVVLVESTDR